jgi:ABC-type transport system involved in cytochrome c biogenesis permease component
MAIDWLSVYRNCRVFASCSPGHPAGQGLRERWMRLALRRGRVAFGDRLTSGGAPVNIGSPGMTFLPIVERELRVAARRRGTYRTRMFNAGLAAVAFAVCFIASLVIPSVSFVKSLFWGLSGLCMLYCLAAGRLMTADCLSREKREGTLGLLFLTDLKGYDVVLGKLAATSLDGFYGLLAVFPMLAIPLLAGGMAKGELWRMALALANTFLFSAAIGLFVSAVSRDERKTMGANLALLLFLAGIPPAIAGLLAFSIPGFTCAAQAFYSCPVFSFWNCADAIFKKSPADFWWSIGVTFSLTLLLLLLACRAAPRSWQDKPVPARSLRRKGARRWRWWREGSVEKADAFRKKSLNRNAYFWLAARPYVKVHQVWTAIGSVGCLWVFTALSTRSVEQESNVVFALLLGGLLKLWITTEAGRQLAEDKKSGAFELLLSTPLTVRDIVGGQWLALRRQFLKPLAVVVGVGLILMVFMIVCSHEEKARIQCLWLAGILMLVADAVALGWVGMAAALTSKSHGRATIKTAFCILALPWLLYGGLELATRLFMFLFARQFWEPDWPFDLGCWFGAGIFVDILFAVKARRRLQTSFRQLVMEPSAPKRRFAWLRDWRSGSPLRKAELRAKLRRKALVAAALLAAGAGAVLYDLHALRANVPKPVVISISASHQPVRVFDGQNLSDNGFFFILPDGSLWTWGGQDTIAPPRRVGTNRDWLQVSFYGNALGVRSNGTLWTWASDSDKPKQFGSGHDWVEAWAGNGFSVARKRDGTLWAWGNNNQNQLGNGPGPNRPEAAQVGTNRDWKAVSLSANLNGNSDEIVALRADGTLWTWGAFVYFARSAPIFTNFPVPIQLCRESNWVGFNGKLENGARNQAGESWGFTPLAGLPGAGVPVAAMGHLLASNAAAAAFGPLFTTNWNYVKYEMRTNGTLWTTPWFASLWDWQAASPPQAPSLGFGSRSDWVSVWGSYQTMIGMTSDGTLWTWGLDYGKESHWTEVFGERTALIKQIIRSVFGAAPPSYLGYYFSQRFPTQKEPRPLLRLVLTNAAGSPSLPP